ncbi:MAG: hypothetical protein JST42_24355 [Bacteroidetes bacterium]|nr:hypothetical protein [Bacteroidota bacterium]
MENIPIRHISATVKEPAFSGSFNIRKVENLLSGKRMVQELHQLSLTDGTTGYMMAFQKDFYSPVGRFAGKNHFSFDPDRFKKLTTLLNIIFQEYSEKRERYQEAIRFFKKRTGYSPEAFRNKFR